MKIDYVETFCDKDRRDAVGVRALMRIDRNPEFLPVVARLWLIANSAVIVWVVLLSKSGGLKKLSACGLVIDVFGAGLLYWETVADNQALRSVRYEVARSAQRNTLSASELGFIILYANMGFLLFLTYDVAIASDFKSGASGLRATIAIVGILVVGAMPAFL